jgi:hypothetical protein
VTCPFAFTNPGSVVPFELLLFPVIAFFVIGTYLFSSLKVAARKHTAGPPQPHIRLFRCSASSFHLFSIDREQTFQTVQRCGIPEFANDVLICEDAIERLASLNG